MVQVSTQKSQAGRALVACTKRMGGFTRPPGRSCKVAGKGLQNKKRRRGPAAAAHRVAVRTRRAPKRTGGARKKTATRRTTSAPAATRRSARTTAGTRGFYDAATGGTVTRRAKR